MSVRSSPAYVIGHPHAAAGLTRFAGRAWLVVSALIAYGSLYPFDVTVPASLPAALLALLHEWSPVTTRGDAIGNVALFVPFGLAGAYVCARQPGVRRFCTVLFAALVLATLVQVAQIYVPPRTPSLGDVAWNLAGAAIGFLAAAAVGARLRLHARVSTEDTIPVIIVLLWIAAELSPLVPSLDLQHAKDSVKAFLRFQLTVPDVLHHAAGVLIAARALAALADEKRALHALYVLLAAIVAGKLLIVGQLLQASTLAGFALAAAGAPLVCRRPERTDPALLALLLAAYTLKALQPFELSPVPAAFHWMPFASLLEGAMLTNAQGLVESLFAFTAMLGLVRMQGAGIAGTALALALWTAALEAAQIYLPGRTADITEPLLVLLVAALLGHTPAPVGYAMSQNRPRPA